MKLAAGRLESRWAMACMLALFLACNAMAVTVRLDEKDASSTVILHAGDRLRVELPAEPGFRWKTKVVDASHLELLSKGLLPNELRPENSHPVGSAARPGTQLFIWKAISAGQADIHIDYGRVDDDRRAMAARQLAIAVEVDPEPLPAGIQTIAKYSGTLPCDGCTGIDVELTLYGVPHTEPLVFVEQRRYRNAPGGDRTIAGTGKMAVQHGTYADASMTVYILAAPDGSVENLKAEGNRLLPLDAQMLPVLLPPGSRYGLTRSSEDGESPP